jgi:RHS repeat-associated protein
VGNLTGIVYPVSSNIAFSYDPLNRLTDMFDAVGATHYAYDNVGQLLSEDGPWNDDTVSYSYANRRRTGLSVLAPNSSPWAQSYAYDAANRLTNIVSPAGAFGYQYPSGIQNLVSSIQLPNGSAITNAFDANARLLATVLINSDLSTLNSHSYSYNVGNQRIQQMLTVGNYVNYTYDNIGQLKTAQGAEPDDSDRLHERFTYTYDKAGNLSNRVQNALTSFFKVNNLNELTTETNGGTLTVAGTTTSAATNVTVSGTGLSSGPAQIYADATWVRAGANFVSGGNTYTATASDTYGRSSSDTVSVNLPATNIFAYDLNGNLRTNGTRIFDYDDENQLIAITEPSAWKSEFTYDGKMRRRIRREYTYLPSSNSYLLTNEVRYVYDGNLVFQERWFQPQLSTTIPQQAVTYTRGRDLSGSLQGAGGIGGLLARTSNSDLLSPISSLGAHAYYHSDGNGNITCLISTNQQLVAKYVYDPFGNTLSMSGPLAEESLYRFSGKEVHPSSGLVCYPFRFYWPAVQKWLSRDPLQEGGGINLYEAFRNAPVSSIDPDGRGVVDCAKALADLARATAKAVARSAAISGIVESGGQPDPGHLKALDQATTNLKDALHRVLKHCGCVAGAAAAATAATAALEAAAAILEEYGLIIILF